MRQAASAPPAPPASSQAASQRAANASIAQSQASLTSRLNQAATNLITSSMLKRAPTFTIPQPRVGGVDPLGSWTGRGARGLGQDPRGPNCRRIFQSPDPLKAYTALVPVEKACKAGVLDEDLHFSTSSETNGTRVSLCLAAFENHIVECGMDPVFNIIKKDGTTINMLQHPGKLAEEDLVTTWITDLTVLGVWDHKTGKRLPVCPQDSKNLDLSGDALYNSSSLQLRESITATLTEEEQMGPCMLHTVIFKIQRPSKVRTKQLEEKAKEISLRNMPAESVEEYNKLMMPILRDLGMSIMTGQVVPDLTFIELDGLNTATDPVIYNIVSSLCIAHDRDSKPSNKDDKLQEAIKVLTDVEGAWRTRATSNRYGPAVTHKAALIQANLAAALAQHRAASSTTGNATRTKPKCWDCDSETHLRGDLACPHKAGKAAPGASKSQSKFTPTHDLTDAVVQVISVLTKAKSAEYPEGTYPPDGTQVFQDGKVVATRCQKCKKWTKGKSMHSGVTHGKQSAASGAAATAAAAAVPPVVPAQLASVEQLQAQFAEIQAQLVAQPAGMLCLLLQTSAPASAPAEIPHHLLASNPPNYSLGRMSTDASEFLGAVPCLPTSMSPVVSFKGAPEAVHKGVSFKGAPEAVHKGATREMTISDEVETELHLTASAEMVLEQMLIQSADSEDSGTDDHDNLMALIGNYNINLNF